MTLSLTHKHVQTENSNKSKIVVAGASGLVGRALIKQVLTDKSHHIIALSRTPRQSNHPLLTWETIPKKQQDFSTLLDSSEAIINLAGENIGSGRWTRKKKKKIVDSRVDFTSHLCQTISHCQHKPRSYIQASALGFYGDSNELKDESSPGGEGFLAELCQNWEAASLSLEQMAVSRFICRFGMVLSSDGGLLPRLATSVRYGFGTILGAGDQWISWIHLDDLCHALIHLLKSKTDGGIYNFCSPHPVQQHPFMKQLASSMHRPILWRAPAFLLRLIFGEMADELLLSSSRANPMHLLKSAFSFQYPTIDTVLSSHPNPLP